MLRSLTFSLPAAFLLTTAASALAQPSTLQEAIFVGAHDVQVSENFSPGAVCFFGEKAFPILFGQTGQAAGRGQAPFIPMAAASYHGKGRVVVFGHSGLVGGEFFKANPDFCSNLLHWLAFDWENPDAMARHEEISIAVIGEQATADFLRSYPIEENGFKADFFRELTDAAVSNQYNVLIINAERIRENQIEAIDAFVKNGGGLLASATGWGWQQINPAGDLKTTFAGNKLTAPMGLVWTDQFAPRLRGGYLPAMGVFKICASQSCSRCRSQRGDRCG